MLPPDGGYSHANADPITGQAAWYDLRVRIDRATPFEAGASAPSLSRSRIRRHSGAAPNIALLRGRDARACHDLIAGAAAGAEEARARDRPRHLRRLSRLRDGLQGVECGGHMAPLPDFNPYGDGAWGVWFNRIHAFEEGDGDGARTVHFPKSCLHCEEPACVTVCPTGASYKRAEDGIVLVDESICIGCKLCSWACPYGAREFDADAGVMKKCTLCIDRIDNQHLMPEDREPACVMVCPVNARHFGDLGDPDSEVSQMVARRRRRSDARTRLQAGQQISAAEVARGAGSRRAGSPAGSGSAGFPAGRRSPAALGRSVVVALIGAPLPGRRACIRRCRSYSLLPLPVPASLCCCCSDLAARSVWCRPSAGFGFVALALAVMLAVGGLVSSAFHLGRPERAWRAFSQWRSSWLSREGVFSVLTFLPAAVFGIGWVFFGTTSGLVGLCGILIAAFAAATIYCTGMIYASLKPIHQWHNPWVVPNYLCPRPDERVACSGFSRPAVAAARAWCGVASASLSLSQVVAEGRILALDRYHLGAQHGGQRNLARQSRQGAHARAAAHRGELPAEGDGVCDCAQAPRPATRHCPARRFRAAGAPDVPCAGARRRNRRGRGGLAVIGAGWALSLNAGCFLPKPNTR